MGARLVEEAIAGEEARRQDEVNVITRPVDPMTSAREGAKTLAKGSVEEDRQRIVVPDPAFYLRDNGDESR